MPASIGVGASADERQLRGSGETSAEDRSIDTSLICTTAPTVDAGGRGVLLGALRALLIASARAAPITASTSST